MSNKNIAARKLFIGARVFTLVSADVDASHKNKGKDLRIETKATFLTPKVVLVNEVKGVKGAGSVDTIIVNGGGEGKLTLPANYEFIENSGGFDLSKHSDVAPAWFSDYEAVADLCNSANEGEMIRLKAIKSDLESQIGFLEAAMSANNGNREAYKVED